MKMRPIPRWLVSDGDRPDLVGLIAWTMLAGGVIFVALIALGVS